MPVASCMAKAADSLTPMPRAVSSVKCLRSSRSSVSILAG